MKKIYAIKEILLYSFILMLFITIDIVLLLNDNIVIGLCSIIFSIALIIKIFFCS